MGRRVQRKVTKREYRASVKRNTEAAREVKKRKKIMKTSQPVHGSTDFLHDTMKNDNLEFNIMKEEIDIVVKEEIEDTVESGDYTHKSNNESGNDAVCETQSKEELWFVRRQLCRGCHSDGAFWSLQTTTEGDSYGELLQTYFNIQLCPVSKDEPALSAICALCAARVREARAFSAQARAAEERFTRLYKQNRVRVLANDEVIKKEVAIDEKEVLANEEVIKKEVALDEKEDDGNEVSDVGEQDTVNLNGETCTDKSILLTVLKNKTNKVRRHNTTRKKSISNEAVIKEGAPNTINEVDDCEIEEAGKTDAVNPNSGDHEVSTDKLAPKPNKRNKRQVGGDKPISKKLYRLLPTDYEHTKGGFECTHCGNMYNTLHSITCHIKHEHMQHSRKKPFKLSPSDFIYIEDSFKCTRCDKKYSTSSEIFKHIKQHLKLARYTCPECGKIFNEISRFTKHKLEEHSIDDRIKCNACDWFGYRLGALNHHKKGFHMLGEKRTCSDCDFVCFTKKAMKRHVVKHSSIKKHHCKYCKKSFLRKSTLDFHERIHTGDKRKVCNICGQAFVQRASLKYHMAKHHPEVRLD